MQPAVLLYLESKLLCSFSLSKRFLVLANSFLGPLINISLGRPRHVQRE